MSSKICTRQMDELGRVVIPLEVRKILGITDLQRLDIYVDNGSIILSPSKDSSVCKLCGESGDDLAKVGHSYICSTCIDKIKGNEY